VLKNEAKKEAACVATSGPSLGRKRPRRAYAAGHAAPQQYRTAPHQLQGIFLKCGGKSRSCDWDATTGRQIRDLYDFSAILQVGEPPQIGMGRMQNLQEWRP
jgi:hypothetical protein